MKLTILIHCPDQSGIIRSVTTFVHQQQGNVVYLDQHVDKQAGVFFMRLKSEFEQEIDLTQFKEDFGQELATRFQMEWDAYTDGYKPKMAIFVSKYNHCLYDLLSRYNSGELAVEVPFILSNHKDLEYVARQFDIPYFHVPVTKENKAEAEDKQLELLAEYGADFIVLARYMQIVSPKVIDVFPQKIINIHHSFLPAFAGAKPYHAAFERGVKIIGATSHYVTEDLDEGPIIEQDVTAVSHTHSVKDFIAKGRDLERIVLSRAVQLHVARKTMVYNNKTVIFS
ncbi:MULTISPECIES: formyltetrahydrofolate deformylase [unclassified Allomuricauda]|uniref:formyltetrahydrofolate deformylase n=1 Tax=unclassified Allomuricauda TaxID=2615049 RepID=UPI001B13A6B7|nr:MULTISPECIES: formyltetrahydrofolate deformylase [unclassified Allomuricauda]MBO6588708.1 formyltetrahydrofolate deformylase [Allomuricauda sp.]MBO6618153.1 formyltetrahydrofolate deformylase [Allomuricauda sp.]MBO6644246.1 formyltetrahydrofolate deformylase [Allomuricauda sp.]MBO6747823.1 formyltetrahydrofolate deformylase [Allomuricauda sp.]MBO6844450.1 formyltetrahydrofolate deformylase [Allomuricauda sp.]